MTKKDEALKLALKVLEEGEVGYATHILREALAEQLATTAKAVGMIEGQMYEDGTRAHNVVHWATRNAENDFPIGTLLYTHPSLPLTHEQRLDVIKEFEKHRMKWDDIAILIDLVEAKHGIGESK